MSESIKELKEKLEKAKIENDQEAIDFYLVEIAYEESLITY